MFLVTAAYVSKEDFGIMAASMLAVEFFRQIFIESMATTVYARRSPGNDDYDASFFIIATCGVASGLIVLFLAGPIANIFKHPEIETALQWMSIIIMTMGLSKTHEIWLTKHLKFKTLALRSIFSVAIGGGIGIYLAMNDYGLVSLVAQQIITSIINLIWLWSTTSWRPTLRVKAENALSLFREWKYLIVNSITALFSTQSDVFFSAYYLGPAATGVYNAAKRILAAVGMIMSGGINDVALPVLTAHSTDKEKLRESFLTCIFMVSSITAPLMAGLAILSPDLVQVLLGQKWIDTVPIISILAVSAFMAGMNMLSVNILLIEQKAHWQTIIGIISAFANVGLLMVFTSHGLNWLAIALLIRTMLFWPIILGLSLKLLSLSLAAFLGAILPSTIFATAMAAFLYLLDAQTSFSSLVNLLVLVPAGAAAYVLLYFLFARNKFRQLLVLVQNTHA